MQKRNENIALLKQYQSGAFQVISRALEKDRISHANLFYGPKNAMKKEMALLLADALLRGDHRLDKEDLSYEEEAVVERIYESQYASFVYIDGREKKAISKDDIDALESKFSRTGGEGNERKVYILEHFENSSAAAMNSLLKFLEEPGQDVYAIITVDNMSMILDTIQSRCVRIPFHTMPRGAYEQRALHEGLDPEDAYFLSVLTTDYDGLSDLAASEEYQTARQMMKQYLSEKERGLLLVDYEYQYKSKKSSSSEARDSNMEILSMFLGMYIQYCHDVLENTENGPAWYHIAVNGARKEADYTSVYAQRLKIALEERDKINRNNDLNLLLAQAVYRLEEVK